MNFFVARMSEAKSGGFVPHIAALMRATTLTILAAVAASPALAQDASQPPLETNQAYIELLARPVALNVDDPMAVFGFVFGSLPERVTVYPTENYYYFGFLQGGIRYAGNLRLDARTRDDGKLNFAYYEDTSQWYDSPPTHYVLLDATQGVTVEKIAPLAYRVSYRGKQVVFALNDLTQAKPPADALSPDETFIGPIFDESGVRFFLVYNSKLRLFHYLLDETVKVAEQFFTAPSSARILIGKRTGFAFYADDRLRRKILVGVFDGNWRANNYFDGPFDQLPDNSLQGDVLRDAINAVDPSTKGRIDRFGSVPDGSLRYMIAPYVGYRTVDDLDPVARCAAARVKASDYYRCFVVPDQTTMFPAPRTRKKRGYAPENPAIPR